MRAEQLAETEGKRAAALGRYVSLLEQSARSGRSKEEQEVTARSLIVELQLSDGIGDEDLQLLEKVEQELFTTASPHRERLVSVLAVLHAKGAAVAVVLKEVRRRFEGW